MDKYDYKTKTRALFALSIGLIQEEEVDLTENFFNLLREFSSIKLKEDFKKYISYVNLVLYIKKIDNRIVMDESEETIQNLYNILDDINSDYALHELYKDINVEDIDKISEFASEYVEYMDNIYGSFYTRIPQ